MKTKVIKVNGYIEFDNGYTLEDYHSQDCCESHYLSFDNIKLEDFDGLKFDLSDDKFFNRIEDYGIELIPIEGFSVKIPGYASNNGYYSSNLSLILSNGTDRRTYDISECQQWND